MGERWGVEVTMVGCAAGGTGAEEGRSGGGRGKTRRRWAAEGAKWGRGKWKGTGHIHGAPVAASMAQVWVPPASGGVARSEGDV